MKTIVYIDGFNLYYGCLKNTSLKWLNLYEFTKSHLGTHHQILEIKYYTAKVTSPSRDPQKSARQHAYLKALESIPNLSIHLGFFLTKEVFMVFKKQR